MIIQPPRAYQVVVMLQFDDDARTDAELHALILSSVSLAIAIASNVRQVGAIAVAPSPPLGKA